jgi:hypothetical protein
VVNPNLFETNINFKILDYNQFQLTYFLNGHDVVKTGKFGEDFIDVDFNLLFSREANLTRNTIIDYSKLDYQIVIHKIDKLVHDYQKALKVENPDYTNVLVLTFEDILPVLETGKCQLTGLPFDFSPSEITFRNLYAPSLDRIDSNKGYSVDNCVACCSTCNRAKLAMDNPLQVYKVSKAIAELYFIDEESINNMNKAFENSINYLKTDSLVLDAGNIGSVYTWILPNSSIQNTQTITALTSGLYVVLVNNGCGTDIDSININLSTPINVDLGGIQNSCVSPILLDAGVQSPNSIFDWTFNGSAIANNNQTFLANFSGNYSVTVTNTAG